MSKSTKIIFYTFDFRWDTTCANEQTDAQTDKDTNKPMAVGEILQICQINDSYSVVRLNKSLNRLHFANVLAIACTLVFASGRRK